MKPSTLQLAFRAISSKIHPQLPLSPKESQQLLSLLQNSFRQHLDRVHPPSDGGRDRNARQSLDRSNSPSTFSSRLSSRQHLESILSDPLMMPRASIAQKKGLPLSERQQLLDEFKRRASDGTATPSLAILNMISRIREARDKASGASVAEILRHDQVVTEILQWFDQASVQTSRVLTNAQVWGPLLNATIARGDYSWYWRFLNCDLCPKSKIIAKKVDVQDELGFDISTIVADFLADLDFADAQNLVAGSEKFRPSAFVDAGEQVTAKLVLAGDAVSTPVYDEMVNNTRRWTVGRALAPALLKLYHPNKQNPVPILKYFQAHEGMKLDHGRLISSKEVLVQAALTASEALLAQDKRSECAWLLQHITERFGQFIGLPMGETEQTEDEKQNVEMIDSLAFG